MHHGAKLLFFRFIQCCTDNGFWRTKKLDASSTRFFDITHPAARLFWAKHRFTQTLTKSDVRNDPRRDDTVVISGFDMAHGPANAIKTAGLADSGNAMRQPEFKNIIGWNTGGRSTDMAVHVDKSGQHIHAG